MLLKIYLISVPIFLAMDMVWLTFIAKDFYKKHLGFLMKSDVNFIAAGIFYLLFLLGLSIFVIIPAIKEGSLVRALILGALFGLVTYATYDLTNLATVKNWPLLVTVVDLIWGAFIAATVSVFTYLIYVRHI